MSGVPKLLTKLAGPEPNRRQDAAESLERVSRSHPQELTSYVEVILEATARTAQPGVQWHLAKIMPRLGVTERQAIDMAAVMSRWIDTSPSSIVRSDALSAIAYLAHAHEILMPAAKLALARALKSGSSAEQARARTLIGRVGQSES